MSDRVFAKISAALGRLPAGTFVLTSCHDGKRAGVLVNWVQRCAEEPLLISVAAMKGHRIEPIIRDSHSFAVCMIDAGNKLVQHKFRMRAMCEEDSDPFDAIGVCTMVTGAPVLRSCLLALDCEVVRHFDLEADYELYVGQVIAARFGEE